MAKPPVVLTHPKLKDRTITVPQSAVHVFEKSGWKTAPKAKQPQSDSTPKTD